MLTLWDLVERVFPSKPKQPARKPAGRTKRPAKTRGPSGGQALPGVRDKTLEYRPEAYATASGKAAKSLGGLAVHAASAPAASMQDRYDAVTRQMLAHYGIRVRRWRSSMSGIAWELRYRDGKVTRLIEAPKPKGPMSVAVFLHEIGHHAIGFNTYRPRCREEYYAWAFALEQMEKLKLNITDSVRKRMHDSLHYAVQKARRRGIKEVPAELEPFSHGRWKRG